MNKQEFIEKLKSNKKNEECNLKQGWGGLYTKGKVVSYHDALELAKQLDEQQKPVIPLKLDEYIKDNKGNLVADVFSDEWLIGHDEIKEWLFDNDEEENNRRYLIAVQAFVTRDYEVEKKPSWVVVVDDGNYYFTKFKHDYNLDDPFQYYSAIGKDEGHRFDDKEMAEAVAKITGGEVAEG